MQQRLEWAILTKQIGLGASAITTGSAIRHYGIALSRRNGGNLSEVFHCIILVSYRNGRARIG